MVLACPEIAPQARPRPGRELAAVTKGDNVPGQAQAETAQKRIAVIEIDPPEGVSAAIRNQT